MPNKSILLARVPRLPHLYGPHDETTTKQHQEVYLSQTEKMATTTCLRYQVQYNIFLYTLDTFLRPNGRPLTRKYYTTIISTACDYGEVTLGVIPVSLRRLAYDARSRCHSLVRLR